MTADTSADGLARGGSLSAPARQRTAVPAATVPVALGLPVVLWQGFLFAAPLVFLVVISFWKVANFKLEPAFVVDNWTRVLSAPAFYRALGYTLGVAAISTLVTLAVAIPLARTIAFRLTPRARDLVIALLIIPVFSSYILRIYAWQVVLSPNGVINSLLAQVGLPQLPLLGGQFALQVGLLTITLPIATLVLAMALAAIDKDWLEAGRNMGCNAARVFLHVALPAIRPALILTASTVFIVAFGDYVSPVFLTGSKPPTLAILVVDTVKSGSQWPRASVVGVSMLAILAAVFLIAALLFRQLRYRKAEVASS